MANEIRLDKDIYTTKYDNLIYDLDPPPEVFSVELAAGTGVLERGTLLARSKSSGEFSMFGETATDSDTLTANAVLAEPVTLGTSKVIGQAYRTGHFSQNMLIIKEGASLTENDKEDLRDVGILLSEMM